MGKFKNSWIFIELQATVLRNANKIAFVCYIGYTGAVVKKMFAAIP